MIIMRTYLCVLIILNGRFICIYVDICWCVYTHMYIHTSYNVHVHCTCIYIYIYVCTECIHTCTRIKNDLDQSG